MVKLFVALSVCTFYLTFYCIFPEIFIRMQMKLELFSPEIVSVLGNKEQLSHFRVHTKSVTRAQTGGQIMTEDRLKFVLKMMRSDY